MKRNNIKTSLGVSNISFGLPSRDIVNSAFFTMAMQKGLNCAIMNPFSQAMMNSYHSYNVLAGLDEACSDYIAYASALSDTVTAASAPKSTATLKSAVIGGMKDAAVSLCRDELNSTDPMAIINDMLIPALNEIGTAFEKGKAFLPQLLMSAEAASAAFEIVKEKIDKKASDTDKKVKPKKNVILHVKEKILSKSFSKATGSP